MDSDWIVWGYVSTALLVIWYWSIVLFTAFYHSVIYGRYRRRRYDPGFVPVCGIVVPCKGTSRSARENLRAYLQQDYPYYEVVFAVEDGSDPAVPLIQELVAEHDHASLVVAGLASTCAQKLHNVLAAVERLPSPEVLVFGDNDITPAPHWLRELILPLSDPRVSVTTGFRWLMGRNETLGELAHSSANIFIYVVFTWLVCISGVGLWGGTMAMRRSDFDALKVAARWRESVVDDISLSQIIHHHKHRSVLVSTCVTHSDDALRSFGAATNWTSRQLLYVKAYHPALWAAGVALSVAAGLLYLLLPVAILGALTTSRSFWAWGGGIALIFVAVEILNPLLYRLLGPVSGQLKFVLLAPLLRLGQVMSYLKTVGTRTICWSGVRYTFDKAGRVVHIER